MQKNKIIRWVSLRLIGSFAFVPLMAVGPMGDISQISPTTPKASQIVFSQKLNIESFSSIALNQAIDPKDLEKEIENERAAKAEAIDSYFKSRGMPLAGTGMKMVEEAEKNDIDWRLLPAIAVRESTGGKHACKRATFSAFGWGSCKINFKSHGHAIEIVAKNLGGNNPNTERHYADKTVLQILRAYNPPSIVPRYAEQVISIMETIGSLEKENKTEVAVM